MEWAETHLWDIEDRLSWLELVVGQDVELDFEEEEYISMLSPTPEITEEDQELLNDLALTSFNGILTLLVVVVFIAFSFNLLFKKLIK